MHFKRTSIAMAIAALAASPTLCAEEHHNGPDGDSVELNKRISITQDVTIRGDVEVTGSIPIHAKSMAVVKDQQINTGNVVENQHHNNNAGAGDNVLNDASGNIGLNIAAGDNNMQDNAAALSAADAYFVFGMADAEVFVTQRAAGNETWNSGNVNNATLSGDALNGASGNIGVNIVAGNSNLQKNNLALSVAPSRMSDATVSNVQMSSGNGTANEGRLDTYEDTTAVTMSGRLSGWYAGHANGGYEGGQSGGYSGSHSGTYSGTHAGDSTHSGDLSATAWQQTNFYPDLWQANPNFEPHDQHPHGTGLIGHADLDFRTQGAVLNPIRSTPGKPVGGLAFDIRGSYGGTDRYEGTHEGEYSGTQRGYYWGRHGGGYAGKEAGTQALSGTFTGTVTTVRNIFTPTENNASLSGNALNGATGNIGVNIAAGTGNLQNNSLAMAATRPALCTACNGDIGEW
jgi:heat shock protein HslJ